MCGIFGWSFQEPIDASAVSRVSVLGVMLADAMDDRGGDSWGIYTPPATVRRGLGKLLDSGFAATLGTESIVMAHTRYATTGETKVPNAHPFTIGNVIGAHNGAVWNHGQLNLKLGRKYRVDSMHVFGHLAEGRDLAELHAYGAIEFARMESPSVIRIAKLPIGELAAWRVNLGGNRGVVWASTNGAITRALKAAGMLATAVQVTPIEARMIYRVEAGEIYDTDDKWTSEASGYADAWRMGLNSIPTVTDEPSDSTRIDEWEISELPIGIRRKNREKRKLREAAENLRKRITWDPTRKRMTVRYLTPGFGEANEAAKKR